MSSQRKCVGREGRSCHRFMSAITVDGHLLCSSCRGQSCTKELTCDTCATWTETQWQTYLSRKTKNEARKAKRTGSSFSSTPSMPNLSIQTTPISTTSKGKKSKNSLEFDPNLLNTPRTSALRSEFTNQIEVLREENARNMQTLIALASKFVPQAQEPSSPSEMSDFKSPPPVQSVSLNNTKRKTPVSSLAGTPVPVLRQPAQDFADDFVEIHVLDDILSPIKTPTPRKKLQEKKSTLADSARSADPAQPRQSTPDHFEDSSQNRPARSSDPARHHQSDQPSSETTGKTRPAQSPDLARPQQSSSSGPSDKPRPARSMDRARHNRSDLPSSGSNNKAGPAQSSDPARFQEPSSASPVHSRQTNRTRSVDPVRQDRTRHESQQASSIDEYASSRPVRSSDPARHGRHYSDYSNYRTSRFSTEVTPRSSVLERSVDYRSSSPCSSRRSRDHGHRDSESFLTIDEASRSAKSSRREDGDFYSSSSYRYSARDSWSYHYRDYDFDKPDREFDRSSRSRFSRRYEDRPSHYKDFNDYRSRSPRVRRPQDPPKSLPVQTSQPPVQQERSPVRQVIPIITNISTSIPAMEEDVPQALPPTQEEGDMSTNIVQPQLLLDNESQPIDVRVISMKTPEENILEPVERVISMKIPEENNLEPVESEESQEASYLDVLTWIQEEFPETIEQPQPTRSSGSLVESLFSQSSSSSSLPALPWSKGCTDSIQDIDSVISGSTKNKKSSLGPLKSGKAIPPPDFNYKFYKVQGLENLHPVPSNRSLEDLLPSRERENAKKAKPDVSVDDLKNWETSARKSRVLTSALDWQIATSIKILQSINEKTPNPDLDKALRVLLSAGKTTFQLQKETSTNLGNFLLKRRDPLINRLPKQVPEEDRLSLRSSSIGISSLFDENKVKVTAENLESVINREAQLRIVQASRPPQEKPQAKNAGKTVSKGKANIQPNRGNSGFSQKPQGGSAAPGELQRTIINNRSNKNHKGKRA